MMYSIIYKKKGLLSSLKNLVLTGNNKLGPDLVAKNLIHGFKLLKKKTYNNLIKNISVDTYIVLSDLEKLKNIIQLKKKNKKIKIVAGPNLLILPENERNILFSNYVDLILVPSKWIKEKYLLKTSKKFKKKIFTWFSGIDHNLWKPKLKKKKIDFLIYKKFVYDKKIFNKCINYLDKKNYNYKIIEYGNYNKKEFLKYLNQAKKLIFFSQSESQGLCLFEAWSCNIPTFIYDEGYWIYNSQKFKSSSAPYLTTKTGLSFNNFEKFKKRLPIFLKKKFYPREWIVENATIKKTTLNLLKIIN